MSQYNLSTEEITRVISLYSRISSPEKRIYAQGYLNGLSALSLIVSGEYTNPSESECEEKKQKSPRKRPVCGPFSK